MREEFHALKMELPEFTAVLDGTTRNMYIMFIGAVCFSNAPCDYG
jgi:Ras-related GTP-binding protein A/B